MENAFQELGKGEFSADIDISQKLIDIFRDISGDYCPLHIDPEYAKERGFPDKVVYGNILGLLISQLVGMNLWSHDVMLISQTVNYKHPIYVGDQIRVIGKVAYFSESIRVAELKLTFYNLDDLIVASGKCSVKELS